MADLAFVLTLLAAFGLLLAFLLWCTRQVEK